jgi:Peptidase family S51
MYLRLAALLLFVSRASSGAMTFACAFVLLRSTRSRLSVGRIPASAATVHSTQSMPDINEHPRSVQPRNKIREGLLISSFSDGLLPNSVARDILSRGLWRCLLTEEQMAAEQAVEESVRFSPCNGPNTEALLRLEQSDHVLNQFDANWKQVVRERNRDGERVLRFLYIPTAMYALRPDSTNTPGRQRQRARADAKQRRDDIVALLLDIMNIEPNSSVAIAAVTLDLDDGSIKHSSVSGMPNESVQSGLPANAKEALKEWRPHLVYVQGGNTFWLHHCLEKSGRKSDLVTLLQSETTFYCGASAGAILAGASMEVACWKGWDDPSVVPCRSTYEAWTGVAGLNLLDTPTAVFPHYDDSQWSGLVLDKSKELSARTGVETICLGDDQVYYVHGNESKLV